MTFKILALNTIAMYSSIPAFTIITFQFSRCDIVSVTYDMFCKHLSFTSVGYHVRFTLSTLFSNFFKFVCLCFDVIFRLRLYISMVGGHCQQLFLIFSNLFFRVGKLFFYLMVGNFSENSQ